MQIFTHNPLRWRGKSNAPAEMDAFRRTLLNSGIKCVVSHASYLINLADGGQLGNRSADAVKDEMENCYQMGIDMIVLHPGSSRDGPREDAIARLAGSLGKILDATEDKNIRLLLETMSGQGGVLGGSLDELERVLDILDWDRRLGVCVDICHVFGAGMDVRAEGGYNRLVSSLDRRFGLDRIGCWHMSDSKGALGSGTDRHEHIGEGEIGVIPFGMLVSDERFANTPMILETPKSGVGDGGNLALLRKLRGVS
jgi:deoxyribonuclease-4